MLWQLKKDFNYADMLASYQALAPPKTHGLPDTQPLHPQTLHDLLKLYAATPMLPTVKDQVELCVMALVSNDMDKTLAIMSLPASTAHDEQTVHAELSCFQSEIQKTFVHSYSSYISQRPHALNI
ncbi:hypothetical protein PAXRUDRAFT_149061 [Paxillus rubicundulus Ve08.2h10]|uniref:Unplaced genomic scaffold scaffold_543, whole genome shotgun sequence n=1 Tax=Paxillus rubicundulus Ve08.2h10 TaxID=930991 RepID=A0A0D0DYF2_9AGAM|nr:hypothetical protein PAXRUDRAFT_149061 [Paxillus rubicundulus Ve08.2h10]